jgi:outer membrane protein assembly factor BamB
VLTTANGQQVVIDGGKAGIPDGAAIVTNDVVFTTTFKGYLQALDATSGAILFTMPMSAGTSHRGCQRRSWALASRTARRTSSA